MREAEGGRIWRAALYLRLSKEDGEEGSIRSQKELLRAFLRDHTGFAEAGVYADEGFSGGNFNRPQFQRLLGDLRAGRADCVIVKDLSRLGRDYIGTGRLIQRVFPAMGVRFIALTDRYDSLTADEREQDFLVPVKNLINDAYCRDISQKVKSRQRLKREQGQFIGAFAPYGYRRDARDRHRLAPDEETAWVVEWVFKRRLAGASVLGISRELERMGILSPSEYRRLKGERYATGFAMGPAARWSPGEVGRILSDETYAGVLGQGRSEKAGYRSQARREKPREQWARKEGAHRAIVSRRDWELAFRLRGVETKGEGNPFAGFVRCGDCGRGMIRRGSGRRQGLVCAAGNRGKGCGWNWIGEEDAAGALAAAVEIGLRWRGGGLGERRDGDPARGKEKDASLQNRGAAVRRQRELIGREIRRCHALKASVQRDCEKGGLAPWEGRELAQLYDGREQFFSEAFKGQGRLLKELREGEGCGDTGRIRCFLLAFVREVLVYREKRILVRLDFADPYL